MARYTGPVCKRCRREGQKLFLKGTKCYTEKCPVESASTRRDSTVPRRFAGASSLTTRSSCVRSRRSSGSTDFTRSSSATSSSTPPGRPGVTGENLIIALESRLDNVVFRMGLTTSRRQARQLVRHRHVQVNGLGCQHTQLPALCRRRGCAQARFPRAGTGGREPRCPVPPPAPRLAGARREETRRQGGQAADPRRHTAGCAGAADRRTLFQIVRMRGSGAWRRRFPNGCNKTRGTTR